MQGFILSVGELLADIITNEYCDSLAQAKTFQMAAGGSPFNLAANIKYMGGDARLVSCVGNDSIGRYLSGTVEQTGLDNQYIQVSLSEPTSIVLVTKSRATPDFIAYRHADAGISPIDED